MKSTAGRSGLPASHASGPPPSNSSPIPSPIPFIRPTMPEPHEWLPFLEESYRRKVFTNFGPCAERLEHELTERFGGGRRRTVLTANATLGLTAALLALNVRGGVIVPSFTFAATAQAVLAAGCVPVLADVDPHTWELALSEVERLWKRQPIGAVVHVRSFGFCRDLREMTDWTHAHNVPLVIDAAAALGGWLPDGRWAGQQGDLEVFSLHATKVFGIGEGGLILCSPQLVPALKRAMNFGIDRDEVAATGCNAKLSEFHAAVGLAVLRQLDAFIARRQAIASQYISALKLRFQLPASDIGAPPWQTFPVAMPDAEALPGLMDRAHAAALTLRRYYRPALHLSGRFHQPSAELKHSADLASRMVCLPVYSDMTDAECREVLERFLRVVEIVYSTSSERVPPLPRSEREEGSRRAAA